MLVPRHNLTAEEAERAYPTAVQPSDLTPSIPENYSFNSGTPMEVNYRFKKSFANVDTPYEGDVKF